jgi:hypothetical protein
MRPMALLALRRKACCGFLSLLKIHFPRPGLNPSNGKDAKHYTTEYDYEKTYVVGKIHVHFSARLLPLRYQFSVIYCQVSGALIMNVWNSDADTK